MINSIPIIIEEDNYNPKDVQYDVGIKKVDDIVASKLKGHVLVKKSYPLFLETFLSLFGEFKLKKLKSITFLTKDISMFEDYVQTQLKRIEAAGGLVVKDDKILMIYRLGKWDLPKGKIEKRESIEDGAVREVEEECGVKVKIIEPLDETWHTYHRKKKLHIKKTHWFIMECLDDSNMMPQIEEDIEKVEWKTQKQAEKLLKSTYKNIKKVIKNYYARN